MSTPAYALPMYGNPVSVGGPSAATGAGAPSWLNTLVNLAQLGGGLYGLYNSSQLNSQANTVFQQSNPFGQYRPQYGAELLNLMQNPSSVTQQPGYQFLLDQGIQAIDRSAAGPGGSGLGSGGEMIALDQYGQGFADQFYNQQIATLAQLAGANINPANPAAALNGLGGAAGSIGNSISGLVNPAVSLLGKLFPNQGTGATSDVSNLISPVVGGSTPFDSGFSNFSSGSGYDPISGTYSGASTPSFSSFSSGSGYSPVTGDYSGGGGGTADIQPVDLSGMFANPSTAGGEAAATGPSVGSVLSTGGSLLNVGTGLASGTPTGYAGAAVSGANLVAKNPNLLGLSPGSASNLGSAATVGGDILGLYTGLEKGGVSGYGQATGSGIQLAGQLAGNPALFAIGGDIVAPLALYNFATNWQSGATGSDALSGAEAGAAIGSVVPGIGTLAGLIGGAVVGGVSSAFGPGKSDPESANWGQYTNAFDQAGSGTGSNPKQQQIAASIQDPYVTLAGLFDLRSGQLKGNIPEYDQFGRMGEASFTTAMTQQIDDALKAGTISLSTSPQQIFNSVVQPWINSFGKGANTDPNSGAINDLLVQMIAQYQSGAWAQDWLPVGGQPVSSWASGIQPFGVA